MHIDYMLSDPKGPVMSPYTSLYLKSWQWVTAAQEEEEAYTL